MTFAGKSLDTTLEVDLTYTHRVCGRLNLGSLRHRDDRDVLVEAEYLAEPFTAARETKCPNCHHYLLTFLIKMMERTVWIPKTQRVVCTCCNHGLKFPYGKCKPRSYCGWCKQTASKSIAEVLP